MKLSSTALLVTSLTCNICARADSLPVPADLATKGQKVMDTTWVKGTDIQNGQLLNEWIAPWSERLISGYLTVLYYQNDETWPTAIQRYVYGLYWDSVHSFGGIEPVFLLGARDPNYCRWSDFSKIVGQLTPSNYHFQLVATMPCSSLAWDHRWVVYDHPILAPGGNQTAGGLRLK